MKTDDLIAALGDDLTPTRPRMLATVILRAAGLGLGVSLMLFWVFWGLRSDLGAVLRDPYLLAKSVLPLGLGVLSLPWMLAWARPGGSSHLKWAVLVFPSVLVILMLATLVTTPTALWWDEIKGRSILTCLTSIPVLSAPVLAGALFAMRRGAPESPALCGAVAGLMAAGFGAAIYSVFCTEDSPLFFGLWYALGGMFVVLAGAVAGSRVLRW